MAATAKTYLQGKLKFEYTSSIGGTTATYTPEFDLTDQLTSGTGLDQGDLVYAAKAVALSGSGTNNLDVAGVIADAYGTTITAVKIKCFYMKNLSTTAGDTITIGNHATAALLLFGAAAHTYTIGPNGIILLWQPSLAGIAVTATTGDILKILNDSASANTYDVGIVFTSA